MALTETGVGSVVIIGATSSGIAVLGFDSFPFAEYLIGALLAITGTVARSGLDYVAIRKKAAAEGKQPPAFDGVSLIASMFASPLMAAAGIGITQILGLEPNVWVILVLMGIGYVGQDAINSIIGILQNMITKKAGQ